jgi:hypothetical protein
MMTRGESFRRIISIYKLNVFYTSCVVYIRSFKVFQAFLQRLKKSLSAVDNATRPSYNRPQVVASLLSRSFLINLLALPTPTQTKII